MLHHMQNLEALNPDLTPEAMSEVDKIIDRHKDVPGSLIPVMSECQSVVGYLPVELQEYIGKKINIPASDIYGVVSFYSFFSMVPKGRHTIKVCMGTACYVRGIKEVASRIQATYSLEAGGTTEDRRFSLEVIRCFGACGLAPVMVVDSDTHGIVTPDGALKILERYT